jgi:hypothetical protein
MVVFIRRSPYRLANTRVFRPGQQLLKLTGSKGREAAAATVVAGAASEVEGASASVVLVLLLVRAI